MSNRIRMARPNEPEAVRTTIVGGRPPAAGAVNTAIPRGIEVLTQKAAVDPAFRQVLLERRAEAAEEIGLTLTAGERLMLSSVAPAQLEGIIDNTRVSPSHVPALLGTVAAVMFAAMGIVQAGPAPATGPTTAPETQEVSAEGSNEPQERFSEPPHPQAPPRIIPAAGIPPARVRGDEVVLPPPPPPRLEMIAGAVIDRPHGPDGE